MIATASADRSIKLWNRDTQECITKLIGHEVYEYEGMIHDIERCLGLLFFM